MVIFPPIAAGVETSSVYSSMSLWIYFVDMWLQGVICLLWLEHFEYFLAFRSSGQSFKPLFSHHRIGTVWLPQRTNTKLLILHRLCIHYSPINLNVN